MACLYFWLFSLFDSSSRFNVFFFLFPSAVAYQRGESVCSAGRWVIFLFLWVIWTGQDWEWRSCAGKPLGGDVSLLNWNPGTLVHSVQGFDWHSSGLPYCRPGLLSMSEPLNQLWLPDSWPNACANHKDCSINCCNNGNGTSDSNMTTYSRPGKCNTCSWHRLYDSNKNHINVRITAALHCVPFPADCIANYGNHAENTQHSSETAIYSDVNLSNKLSEMKMFPNSSLCYTSPDGDSSATYEPIPYATTQLIQANIKNKAAAAGAIAEPLDMPCWKQQPPNLPPIPKDIAAQMQYNITEQNMLIKGKLSFHLVSLKK